MAILHPYRRHSGSCKLAKFGTRANNCTCMIWVDGYVGTKRIKESLKTRDWNTASEKVRRRLLGIELKVETVALDDAVAAFLNDLRARQVKESTLRGFRGTLNHLLQFANQRDLEWMEDITADHLAAFRAGRVGKTGQPLKSTTSRKELETLRALWNMAVERDWVKVNVAKRVRPTVVPGEIRAIWQYSAIWGDDLKRERHRVHSKPPNRAATTSLPLPGMVRGRR